LSQKVRIALIHATPVAIEPVRLAFKEHWRSAELINILDDSLSFDLANEIELTNALSSRIVDLAYYARTAKADAILYTCSAFGAAIEEADRIFDGPVLKPNEAMFAAALEIQRHGRPP